MSLDVIDIIEAAYRVTLPEPAWIDGILQACAPILKTPGVYGYVFDASGPNLHVGTFRGVPHSEGMEQALRSLVDGVPRHYVEQTWLGRPFGLASEIPGSTEILERSGAPYKDVLAINGFDASGKGLWVGTPLAKRRKVAPATATRWSRVAAHLGAAYRMRRALAGRSNLAEGASAIFSPDGTVEHAEGEAADNAELALLRASAIRLNKVRDPSTGAPDARLSSWKGLVDAQWSLVDHFESDGKRFVVARANAPSQTRVKELSTRERQVLACLSIGHSTKETAYELGLSQVTVRVLLLRAMRKLGASSRTDAIARFKEHAS